MTSAGTEWTTTVPLTSLERSRRYTLYGWTKDNGWSAGEVSFTLEEISSKYEEPSSRARSSTGPDSRAVTVTPQPTATPTFKTATCKNVE